MGEPRSHTTAPARILLTVREVRRIFGVSRSTVYRWIERGRLKKVGRVRAFEDYQQQKVLLVEPEDPDLLQTVEAWLQRRRQRKTPALLIQRLAQETIENLERCERGRDPAGALNRELRRLLDVLSEEREARRGLVHELAEAARKLQEVKDASFSGVVEAIRGLDDDGGRAEPGTSGGEPDEPAQVATAPGGGPGGGPAGAPSPEEPPDDAGDRDGPAAEVIELSSDDLPDWLSDPGLEELEERAAAEMAAGAGDEEGRTAATADEDSSPEADAAEPAAGEPEDSGAPREPADGVAGETLEGETERTPPPSPAGALRLQEEEGGSEAVGGAGGSETPPASDPTGAEAAGSEAPPAKRPDAEDAPRSRDAGEGSPPANAQEAEDPASGTSPAGAATQVEDAPADGGDRDPPQPSGALPEDFGSGALPSWLADAAGEAGAAGTEAPAEAEGATAPPAGQPPEPTPEGEEGGAGIAADPEEGGADRPAPDEEEAQGTEAPAGEAVTAATEAAAEEDPGTGAPAGPGTQEAPAGQGTTHTEAEEAPRERDEEAGGGAGEGAATRDTAAAQPGAEAAGATGIEGAVLPALSQIEHGLQEGLLGVRQSVSEVRDELRGLQEPAAQLAVHAHAAVEQLSRIAGGEADTARALGALVEQGGGRSRSGLSGPALLGALTLPATWIVAALLEPTLRDPVAYLLLLANAASCALLLSGLRERPRRAETVEQPAAGAPAPGAETAAGDASATDSETGGAELNEQESES